jgi:hypothetical protein
MSGSFEVIDIVVYQLLEFAKTLAGMSLIDFCGSEPAGRNASFIRLPTVPETKQTD